MDPRGPARREPCRQESDDHEQTHDRDQRHRVRRAHIHEQSAHEAGREHGHHDPDRDTQADEQQPLAEDSAQDVPLVRAERHAEADLPGPLRDAVGEHAEDPDGGEREPGQAESAHQRDGQALRKERASQHVLHGGHRDGRDVRIDATDLTPDRRHERRHLPPRPNVQRHTMCVRLLEGHVGEKRRFLGERLILAGRHDTRDLGIATTEPDLSPDR